MPRIRWSGLPPALRDHLFDRLRERKITAEDLYQLKVWRESNPDAPDGLWYKDFGSFKICGDGKYPKTFLLAGQAAKGQKLRDARISIRSPVMSKYLLGARSEASPAPLPESSQGVESRLSNVQLPL